ncbi:MAG: nicotinamide mononucleotide transporter [Ruminococcaceae bacterium]|nr:nicotinamide mononucleotide transporter [Oscillospiraceae bacterium]
MTKMTQKTIRTVIIVITFFAIAIAGIISKQDFFRILPLFISLFVVYFQADANRYAYLVGAFNALLYGVVYFSLGLYALAANAVLFSTPIQIMIFVRWQKRAYERSTIMRKMSIKTRLIYLAIFVAAWIAVFIALTYAGSQYEILDNTASLLSALVLILTLFAYVEYPLVWVINSIVNIILNIQVTMVEPGHVTYLIYSIYNLYCSSTTFVNVNRLYKKQQKGIENTLE